MHVQKQARIHRHHERIALDFTDTETLYLSPAMASTLAEELQLFVMNSRGDKWPVTRLINDAGQSVNESDGRHAHKYI